MSDVVMPPVGEMDGLAALPRDNGELVFDAPWQGRVLAMAVGLVQRFDVSWDTFRARLIQAVTDHPGRPYYESWTIALESLVIDLGIAESEELEQRGVHLDH